MLTRNRHEPTARPQERTLEVLAVGDLDQSEFSAARCLMETCSALTVANTLSDGCPQPVDLIAVFQSRPGSFPADWVQAARERLPLAGFVTILGSWCEGEERTGVPLPFCERVFWYRFEPWWQANHAAWLAGRPTSWQGAHSLQVRPTVSTTPQLIAPKLIAIDAPDADAPDALIIACSAIGYSALWSPAWRAGPLSSPPAAGIWVGRQLNSDEELRLARFRQSLPAEVPLVALLDFPRRERVERAIELGATTVLGKPWRLEDLALCLKDQTEKGKVVVTHCASRRATPRRTDEVPTRRSSSATNSMSP